MDSMRNVVAISLRQPFQAATGVATRLNLTTLLAVSLLPIRVGFSHHPCVMSSPLRPMYLVERTAYDSRVHHIGLTTYP